MNRQSRPPRIHPEDLTAALFLSGIAFAASLAALAVSIATFFYLT